MFKIIKIQYTNHPVLKNETFNFVDQNEELNQKYVLLLIGENGTGKSQLLTSIADILYFLNEYNNKKVNSWNKNYRFEITLYNGKSEIVVDSHDDESLIKFKKIKGLKLPNKVLANAYTFNDKFFWRKGDNEFYNYGGLRTVSNNIFINSPNEDTFKNLCVLIEHDEKKQLLSDVFDELSLEYSFKVNYDLRRNKDIILTDEVFSLLESINKSKKVSLASVESFKNIIGTLSGINEKDRKKRYQDDKINRFINKYESDKIGKLLTYLSKLVNDDNSNSKRTLLGIGGKGKAFNIKLESNFIFNWSPNADKKLNKEFEEHILPYTLLSELDILSFESLEVKRNEFVPISDVSSGEFHLLHLFSFILANVKNNCVVLLDEPEISLHVNWQYRFFKLFNPICYKFPDSHFFIASHSHFLVSDLKSESSSILTLNKDKNGNIIPRNLEKIDTYGWSTEQILFEVFNLPSDRNYYLSNLVTEIINELSKNKKNNKILAEKMSKLNELKNKIDELKDVDPMKSIIKQIYDLWDGEKQVK